MTPDRIAERIFTEKTSHDWSMICRGCGECCRGVPLPRVLIEKYRDRLQVPCEFIELDDEEHVVPIKHDAHCPFLSRHDRRCVVYSDRPAVCRIYGEIPELQCPKVNPAAAKLSTMQMVESMCKRLGIEICHPTERRIK